MTEKLYVTFICDRCGATAQISGNDTMYRTAPRAWSETEPSDRGSERWHQFGGAGASMPDLHKVPPESESPAADRASEKGNGQVVSRINERRPVHHRQAAYART